MVYLQESEFDLGINEDLISFLQAWESVNFFKWFEAMIEKLKSMNHNNVWHLVEF